MKEILHREGDAVERPERDPLRPALISRRRDLERRFGEKCHKGVQGGVMG
ncbi:hypothetical protein SMD27_20945 [Dongia soli]|uniref:Uncharacterized protein n=1 Tax=Dongia soli TaxID=600628 RepID=A0ABU5EHF9_9PROT|nr:hypothetical protein [Dongia soli]MDY0885322.1 hypothetical protein [Dongia soli]